MKAKLNYASGLMLLIPKIGHAPMLFLEWISEQPKLLIKVRNDTDGVYNGYLSIRITNAIREDYNNALEYINNNL